MSEMTGNDSGAAGVLGRGAEAPGASAARLVAWAMGLALAAPVVAARYPPMADLPFHESLVALLRHFGDVTWEPPGVYLRSFGAPNQLFHLGAWALSLVLPTDTACKLVAGASIATTPPAAARLARHFGRVEWSALWVAPLTLGFAFHWGLVGNVLAFPVLLASIPALDQAAANPRFRSTLTAVILVVLLYLAHESALVVGALAAAVFAARPDRRSRWMRLAPVVIGVALATFYAWWGQHLKAPSILANPDSSGSTLGARLREAPDVLFGTASNAPLRYALFGAYVLSLCALAVSTMRAGVATDTDEGLVARIERGRLAWIGLACVMAYLVGPFSLGGATLLYERFLPVGCALLSVALAPRSDSKPPRLLPLIGGSMSLATLCVSLPAFGDSDRRFRELDALLPLIERNQAVAQLDLTPKVRGRVAPVLAAGGRVLAERGGRLLFSFTDAPTSPVVVASPHQWNGPVLRLTRDPFALDLANDLRLFRYVLVHLDPEWVAFESSLVRAFAPEARFVADSGEWLLFESTLPTLPLSAPEPRSVVTPGSTLRQRLSEQMHSPYGRGLH